MAKFNAYIPSAVGSGATGYITSESQPSGTTHQGGAGYARNEKSELFLLAVSSMVGESSFYESASERDARIVALSRKVAAADRDWTTRFVRWLRTEANLRSVALVVALEGAKSLLDLGIPGGRVLVRQAILRADEPGEAIAYWHSRYGRNLPKPIKRGIADGAVSTYSEYSLGKYDTASHNFRFADVLQMTHPTPTGNIQAALFKYALDRRYNTSADVPRDLPMLTARKHFLSNSPDEIRRLAGGSDFSESLAKAGLTWENLSGAIAGGMDAQAWEAVIPSMGYMALLRNLRNFLQASVSSAVLDNVAATIASPDKVAKSRQLPMSFLAAYQATQDSLVFASALDKAINLSLNNIPALSGDTLVLVDRSASMFWSYSEKSDLSYANTAAVFGTALALRAEKASLVQFGSGSADIPFNAGDSVLKTLDKFESMGGTNTESAVRRHFDGHDRVVILTDEQSSYGYGPGRLLPSNVPLYTWNLVGYAKGHAASGPNRHTIGGLTDKAFSLIQLVEAGKKQDWPF